MNKLTREDVRNFLVWHFTSADGRAQKLGDLLFLFRDTYGLSLPTMMKAAEDSAQKYADENIDAVWRYVDDVQEGRVKR